MAARKSTPDEWKAHAINIAARETLGIELVMEHKDAVRSISVADLRRALERAYELGRKSGMS